MLHAVRRQIKGACVTRHWYSVPVFIFGSMSLAGCGGSESVPQGQVVARVNGQDITLSELNAELLANNLSGKAEDKTVTQSVLQRLIARKLLVDMARDEKLDKNSEFILTRQRSEENELAALAQRHMLSRVKPPSKEEAEKYVRDHPQIFTGRKLMVLDQIRFLQPANANDIKALEDATSLDAVAEMLKQNAIRYDRAPNVFDTTSVSPEMSAKIDGLPAGELFVISNGKMVLVNVIREKQPAAIPADAALQYASQLIQQEKATKAIAGQVADLRKIAKISYQPAYDTTKK